MLCSGSKFMFITVNKFMGNFCIFILYWLILRWLRGVIKKKKTNNFQTFSTLWGILNTKFYHYYFSWKMSKLIIITSNESCIIWSGYLFMQYPYSKTANAPQHGIDIETIYQYIPEPINHHHYPLFIDDLIC